MGSKPDDFDGALKKSVQKAAMSALPEIRKGDDRWLGLMKMWFNDGKPAQILMGNTAYLVLQDPETKDYFFRPIDSASMMLSRSL